jgi:tRNA A37 threonylcarbamoyladenosine synthetase subunit TsaC/SUA5/YrdC
MINYISFKEKVFQVVRKIKAGKFLSYKEVAKRSGNEKAYRAVANILKNSPQNVPLKISDPIIAPSANWEGHEPAKNIKEAKKYFKNKVFYLDRGNLISKPSTLIDLKNNKIEIIRKGANFNKIKNYVK